jgi:hypothetical protein
MARDKFFKWTEKENKTLQYSVPWDNAIQELYKTYTPKQIFNFMVIGELSYSVNMIDESKPHGLDALWLYGSDRLEDFLKDYNVRFYQDSLKEIIERVGLKPEFLGDHQQQIEKTERPSTKDKKTLQAWVKSLGENPPGQSELAREAKKKSPWKTYTEKTLIKWIKPVHPDHTPGKPGRKKSK